MTAYDVDARTLASQFLDTIANSGFGQAVTLSHTATGAYDPATGAPSVTTTTQTASGVLLDYPISLRSRGGQGVEAGSLILEGDKQLLLSPLNSGGTSLTAPVPTDTATVNGVTYTILAVGTLAPAGTTIMFDCHVRVG